MLQAFHHKQEIIFTTNLLTNWGAIQNECVVINNRAEIAYTLAGENYRAICDILYWLVINNLMNLPAGSTQMEEQLPCLLPTLPEMYMQDSDTFIFIGVTIWGKENCTFRERDFWPLWCRWHVHKAVITAAVIEVSQCHHIPVVKSEKIQTRHFNR